MVGDVIGNYRILRKIGEGGMGTVYIAEHTLIGRKAAIKVLQREMSYRRELVTRFFNEAKAATAVKHPGIVELYDFGYAGDGSAYIVMEYLEGESLTRRLARLGTFAETSAVALCRQIAGGLGAAHAQGIVHRDLKPDNIFIVRDPDIAGGERTKILDFGIAKLPRDAAGDQSVTLDGQIVGTPAYMSPEQCKGARSVDQRADLYALGCILFEMMCGRGPFVGEGAGEVMAQHIYVPVPGPSSIRPVTPRLEHAILRALAKDPAHRFQSAEEMSEALHAAVMSTPVPAAIGQPGTATPVWVAPPAVALPQQTTLSQASGATVQVVRSPRRPWRAIAIAAAIVGGVAIAGGALRPREPRASAVAMESSQVPAPVPQPSASQPSASQPSASQPSASQPSASQPSASQPTASQPSASQPTASQPSASQPTASQPTASQPATAASAASTTSGPSSTAAAAPATPAPAGAGRETESKSTRATTKQVKIHLRSDPPGAEVFRMPQGVRIGSTPLAYTMDATSGKVTLALKRRGYAEMVIAVPGDRDHDQMVALGKLAARSPPAGETGAGSAAEAAPVRGSLDPFEKLEPRKPEGKRP